MSAERARITIFDTTLRDGEQSPGCSMNQQEKLRLAQQLDRLGVDVIEAGFPIASDGDFESVKAIASVVRRPVIAGLARACRPDIERAWQLRRLPQPKSPWPPEPVGFPVHQEVCQTACGPPPGQLTRAKSQ